MGQRGKAPQRFALPQARVHQQARPGSFKQSAIARTARRENAHAKADGFSPKSFTQHARWGSAISEAHIWLRAEVTAKNIAAARIIAKAQGTRQ